MNPLRWKREHQVALTIAALIGAVIGPLAGYGLSNDGWSLSFWFGRSAFVWIIGGAAIGAAIVYVIRLARA